MALFDFVRELLGLGRRTNENVANPNSTAISNIKYNPTDLTMDITFRDSQSTYRYHMVTRSEYQQLKSASSVGRHFVFNVRNEHSFTRLS